MKNIVPNEYIIENIARKARKIGNLPAWLSAISVVNPVTYGVDTIRGLMLGTYHFGLLVDFVVLVVFALVVVVIGTLSFRRMKL